MDLIKKYTDYYQPKIERFGATFKGVDWGSEEAQKISFEQLIKLFEKEGSEKFSLLDYGCGYGALLEYLKTKKIKVDYFGYDILPLMLKTAKKKHTDSDAIWLSKLDKEQAFDYTIASGVFTLKMEESEKNWEEYVLNSITQINKISKKGFAFNCLTSYSDKHLMKSYLYYSNPLKMFDFCKTNFSKQVALLHDYQKYEFTIIVKK